MLENTRSGAIIIIIIVARERNCARVRHRNGTARTTKHARNDTPVVRCTSVFEIWKYFKIWDRDATRDGGKMISRETGLVEMRISSRRAILSDRDKPILSARHVLRPDEPSCWWELTEHQQPKLSSSSTQLCFTSSSNRSPWCRQSFEQSICAGANTKNHKPEIVAGRIHFGKPDKNQTAPLVWQFHSFESGNSPGEKHTIFESFWCCVADGYF